MKVNCSVNVDSVMIKKFWPLNFRFKHGLFFHLCLEAQNVMYRDVCDIYMCVLYLFFLCVYDIFSSVFVPKLGALSNALCHVSVIFS